MIDKPDPAKDAGRSDAAGAKRPHATLDLKATEVKPAAPQTPAPASSAPSASAAKAASAAAPSSSTPSSSTASAATAPASGAPASKAPGAAESATAAKASSPGTPPKPEPAAKPAAKPASAPSGGGGLLSHLAAGGIGGALVYAGAAFLGPDWLPGTTGESLSHLASRIATLEAAPKESGNVTALDARIGDVETRLARLDKLERNIAAVGEAQRALETETRSLSDAARQGDGERLSKLEEQLRMIAEGSAPSSGNVGQLAAISGKIADVESSLKTEIAELRKSLPAEAEQQRLAATQEAGEAAKAATLRLDRELSQIRTEQARSTQRVETATADVDRLAASVTTVKEETARLSGALGEFRSAVDSQLRSFAKPADVTAAVGPVNSKLAELEQNVQSVVQNEQSRRQNAERIVLSLELSNLKRALDRGQGHGYAAELEEVRKVSAGQLDLSPLERFKDTGVATTSQLQAEFRPLINAAIDADLEPADGSVIDRLLAGAKSVVRVRKVSHDPGDTSTEAVVSRIQAALDAGRLGDVLGEAEALSQRARIPLEDWLIKVTARDTVDRAIAGVESRLKASLSGAPDHVAPDQAAPATPADAPAPQQN